jgi:hypothetical protein
MSRARYHLRSSFFISVLIFIAAIFNTHHVSSAAMTEDERNNVAVYEKASEGVVNVTSTAMQLDFFFNAYPTQGSGSGSIIDANNEHRANRGYAFG